MKHTIATVIVLGVCALWWPQRVEATEHRKSWVQRAPQPATQAAVTLSGRAPNRSLRRKDPTGLQRQLVISLPIKTARRNHQSVVFSEEVTEYLNLNPHFYANKRVKRNTAHLGQIEPGEAYFKGRIQQDWQVIERFLPKSADSILDIGSGLGGMALLLSRRYGKRAKLHLAEKGEKDFDGQQVHVLSVAKRFLVENKVPAENIHLYDPKVNFQALASQRFDLIVSFRALGYIFPYEIYRQTIRDTLRRGASLIMDVRRNEIATVDAGIAKRFGDDDRVEDSLMAQLRSDFDRIAIIEHTGTYRRVVASGPRANHTE